MRLLLLLPRATTIVSPTTTAVGRRRRRRRRRHHHHHRAALAAFSSKQRREKSDDDDVTKDRPPKVLSSKDVLRRLGKLKRDCVENKTRETTPTSEAIGKRFSEVCSFVLSFFRVRLRSFESEGAEEMRVCVISLKHANNN